MMAEADLDIVQQDVLASLRSSMKAAASDDVNTDEQSLAMFGLASQLSAESVSLGYKPQSLFMNIMGLYSKASEDYRNSGKSDDADANISDLTKLLSSEFQKSPLASKVGFCDSVSSGWHVTSASLL